MNDNTKHNEMKSSKETMKIIFDGQTHQIDANTLINFLIHYKTVVDATNSEIGDGTKKIIIKVNSLEKGSFIIDIELVEGFLDALFSKETIGYLGNIAAIVSGIFVIYKKKKGAPVEKEDIYSKLIIKESDSSIIINDSTIKIYNQPVVREAISKSIETADKDPSVEGLRIENKKGNAVSIRKEDFKDLIYDDFSSEISSPTERIVIDDDAMLGITKLSFEKGFKWGFIYNGFNISITVKDDELMRHIDNGASFAKGDHIKVKLKILQSLNTEFNVYENKTFTILEFHEHIQNPSQNKMFTKKHYK